MAAAQGDRAVVHGDGRGVSAPEPYQPMVAIVGRPNVGKSTLLNRIIGRREAIVEERPGVTRDRKEVVAEWNGRSFRLVDTGGWLPGGTALDEKVSRQSDGPWTDADAIFFVVDGTIGLTEEDSQVARLLQRTGKPVLVVVNKIDHIRREGEVWEFLQFGLGDPYPVSALHGRGTGDLLDDLLTALDAALDERAGEETTDGGSADAAGVADPQDAAGVEDARAVFSVAIVGRPNVGKSTLFNRLIGDERAVVHDMPGTTRDAIDTLVDTEMGPVRFIDTAGMRRKARIDEDTEYFSFVRALKAVDTANVALLVIDASIGVTHQDQRLAERVDGAGCPILVLLNKWETVDADQRQAVKVQISQKLHFVGDSPVLSVSALTGKGMHRLIPALAGTIDEYRSRVPTSRLNRVLREAQAAQPAPHGGRVLYATQGATDPPTFTLFANKTLPSTYLRYLERRIRESCDLEHTPIRMRVRHR